MVDQIEAPQQEEKKGGAKKIIIMIVALLAVAGGVYFFMFAGAGAPEPEPEATEPVEGVVIDGATMTVALQGDGDTINFVRISFAVVLAEGADSTIVGNRIQILQDGALTVIAGYTASELRTVEGLDRLRADLSAKALEVYPDGEVMRVVLTEVIVQ